MKNMVVLQKDEDGNIWCQQLTEKGIKFVENVDSEDDEYWEKGGTIVLDEIEEILDKEV